MVKLIDAFDVGKHARHNLVGKHVMFTISENHLEMKNLQYSYKQRHPVISHTTCKNRIRQQSATSDLHHLHNTCNSKIITKTATNF